MIAAVDGGAVEVESTISGKQGGCNPCAYNRLMTPTNNVTRMLDARKIDYTALQLPDEKLGALEAAQFLGAPPEAVYKTIVVTREKPRPPLLVLVAGTATVDLKNVAAVVGDKKVHLPTEREAEALTGLQAGGISPLALINKGFRVLIDEAAQAEGFIHVSGGQRGLNIRIGVEDLVRLTKARLAPVSAPLPADALE
jgi:Cys-tRNA(Pro)/Cys-tRNA(Cys) deacylase